MAALEHRRASALALCIGCCLALLVPRSAPAQGPQARTEPTFVRVTGPDGAALAGAQVTFVGSLPEIDGGPTERIEAISDARGRVTVRLRSDLCHSAWAVAPAAADGSAAVSALEGLFAAGAMLELACTEVMAPRRIRAEGLDAWQDQGPLSLFVVGWNPAADAELEFVDGHWLLPPSPLSKVTQVGVLTLEVRTRDGQPLHWFQGDRDVIELPPPQRVELVAIDAKTQQPMPAVKMQLRVGQLQPWRLDGYGGATRSVFRALGDTGPEGRLVAVVPYAQEPLGQPGNDSLLFFADAPGCAQVVGGVRLRAVYENDRRVANFAATELKFVMNRMAALAGDCGSPLPGTMAQLQVVAKLWSSDNGFTHDHRAWIVPVDAEGAFAFDGVPQSVYSARISFWHPLQDQALPLFQAQSGRLLPADLRSEEAVRAAREQYAEVDVQVLDVQGGPARGGVLQIAPGDRTGTQLRYSIVRVPLDTAGAARLRLPSGPVALLATTANGFAPLLVNAPAGASAARLQLQPFARMSVRFLTLQGEPIVGATAHVVRATTRGSSDPLRGLMQGMESHLRWRMQQIGTGPDGRLTIPFAAVDGISLQLALRAQQGNSLPFALEELGDELLVHPK